MKMLSQNWLYLDKRLGMMMKSRSVLALINEVQIQNSCSSDEESVTVPPTKIAKVCKLAQIPPEIWMTLPLEAKKWLLNDIKRQKQDEKKQEIISFK
jgi:hypothetical protein